MNYLTGGGGRLVCFFRDITERKSHERETERLNRLYAALSVLNQTIVRVKSREELFREVCRIVVEKAGFKVVWIGWADPTTHAVSPVARAGTTRVTSTRSKSMLTTVRKVAVRSAHASASTRPSSLTTFCTIRSPRRGTKPLAREDSEPQLPCLFSSTERSAAC